MDNSVRVGSSAINNILTISATDTAKKFTTSAINQLD